MANYAYLCVSDRETIYPAFADEFYDPATSTISSCAWNVPLLWFGLFRPSDLVTKTFHTDDGPYVVTAPITTRDTAILQLFESLPRLQSLFADRGSLDAHAKLLAEAIHRSSGRYATVEWDEIDVITEGGFLAEATAAMASLDTAAPANPDADRLRLQRLSGIGRINRPFPPAQNRLDQPFSDSAEEYLHTRLTGVSHPSTERWLT